MSSQLVSEIKELGKERKSGSGRRYMKKLCSSLFIGDSYICSIIMTLFPVSMIIIGALYFKRSVYCPPEPIALLLIIFGIMMFVTGSITFFVRVTSDFFIDEIIDEEDKLDEISKKASKPSKNDDAESTASEDPEAVKKNTDNKILGSAESESSEKREKRIKYKKKLPTWIRVMNNVIHILYLATFVIFIVKCVFVYRHYAIVDYKNKNNTETYCDPTLYKFAFWSMNVIFILIGIIILASCCLVLMK